MAGVKFCHVSFKEFSKIIPLPPGDSKKVLIEAFKIELQRNEDILISDEQTDAIIASKDLFDLISSLQRPTDMKFVVQSMFQLIIYYL